MACAQCTYIAEKKVYKIKWKKLKKKHTQNAKAEYRMGNTQQQEQQKPPKKKKNGTNSIGTLR